MLVSFAKGHEYKNGYVMWPVRTAVSGKQMTPGGATELMELLGKEESLKRINDAIAKLEAALAQPAEQGTERSSDAQRWTDDGTCRTRFREDTCDHKENSIFDIALSDPTAADSGHYIYQSSSE